MAAAGRITEQATVSTFASSSSSSFNGFAAQNISGATLTGVSFDFSYSGSVDARIQDTTPLPSPYLFLATVPLTISANSGANKNSVDLATNIFSGVATGTGFHTVGSTSQSGDLAVGEFFTGLSFYNGSFTVLEALGTSSATGSNGQHFPMSGVGSISGTVTVTYEYTTSETPEPASFSLLGSALLGLGLAAKRFSKR